VKTAFVSGGAGFLGLNLVEQLVSAGWKVVVFDPAVAGAATLEKPAVRCVEGDVTDIAACRSALPEGVDAVFHLAADTSHWSRGDARQSRVNVRGTHVMVSAALEREARRFVRTSSIAAYGPWAGCWGVRHRPTRRRHGYRSWRGACRSGAPI
jgi:nucleoside-diphosphate-sugar epimerase